VSPEEYQRNAEVYGRFDMDPCPGVIQTEMLMNLYTKYCKPETNVSECQIKSFKRFLIEELPGVPDYCFKSQTKLEDGTIKNVDLRKFFVQYKCVQPESKNLHKRRVMYMAAAAGFFCCILYILFLYYRL
jgi:hypothetical protein